MAKINTTDLLKFKRLRLKLGISTPLLLGHLELIWRQAHIDATPIMSCQDLEAAAEWEGDDGKLASTMIETGWLDEVDGGHVQIHDYWDHAPKWVRSIASNKRKDQPRRTDGKFGSKCNVSRSIDGPQNSRDGENTDRKLRRDGTVDGVLSPDIKQSKAKQSKAAAVCAPVHAPARGDSEIPVELRHLQRNTRPVTLPAACLPEEIKQISLQESLDKLQAAFDANGYSPEELEAFNARIEAQNEADRKQRAEQRRKPVHTPAPLTHDDALATIGLSEADYQKLCASNAAAAVDAEIQLLATQAIAGKKIRSPFGLIKWTLNNKSEAPNNERYAAAIATKGG